MHDGLEQFGTQEVKDLETGEQNRVFIFSGAPGYAEKFEESTRTFTTLQIIMLHKTTYDLSIFDKINIAFNQREGTRICGVRFA